MKNLELISVEKSPKGVVVIHNPTDYPLIGSGKQGAVFKLSEKYCAKIFASQKDFKKEYKAYIRAQGSPIIPKLYGVGPKYIIIEYIKGITLKEYLRKKRALPISLIKQILSAFHEMKRLKFTRINVRLKHIILTQKHKFKIIDHVNSFTLVEIKPILLFNELPNLGLLHHFLRQVKKLDKKIYSEWNQSMSKYFKA